MAAVQYFSNDEMNAELDALGVTYAPNLRRHFKINRIRAYCAPSRGEADMQRAEQSIGLLRRSEAASQGPGEEFMQDLSASTGMDEGSLRMLYQQTKDQLRANLDRRRI